MYINNDQKQPDALSEILALRPNGADVSPKKPDRLYSRIKGALVGRLAGCMLGVPVEQYTILRMQAIAMETGTSFPPITYWKGTDREEYMHYGINSIKEYLEEQYSNVKK